MRLRLLLAFAVLLAAGTVVTVKGQLVMRPPVHCQVDCGYEDGYLRCYAWCTDRGKEKPVEPMALSSEPERLHATRHAPMYVTPRCADPGKGAKQ